MTDGDSSAGATVPARARHVTFIGWHALLSSQRIAVLCDLDGTLVPFAATVAAAGLDDDAASLLRQLGEVGVQVSIVSGRPRSLLAELVGRVPAAWWFAEHGAWRFVDGEWQCRGTSMHGHDDLVHALGAIVDVTPGAMLESKTAGVAVHWRGVAEARRGAFIARVTGCLLGWLAQHPGYERLPGVLMVEVRPRGLHKGSAVAYARSRLPGVPLLAIGDDVTDEDMFRALGEGDIAVSVGRPLDRTAHARLAVADVAGARRFLRWLVDARAARGAVVGEPAAVDRP